MRRVAWRPLLVYGGPAIFAAATVALYLLTAAAPPPKTPPRAAVRSFATGLHDKQVRVDGLERSYKLYIPRGVTSEGRYPLVVLFHGAGADAEAMRQAAGFERFADTHKLIIAYGNGTTDEQRGESVPVPADQQYSGRIWHSGRTFTPNIRTIDDVAYAKAVVSSVAARLPIDTRRVFVAGFSNGGSLAYRLACEAGDTFTAAAAVGSALEINDCPGRQPVSLLAIYGTADGSYDPAFVRGSLEPKRSVTESNRLLAQAFGCRREATRTYGPHQAGGYGDCRKGAVVQAIALPDIGHTWTPDMSDAIAAFFKVDR